MATWSTKDKDHLGIILKEWLKQQGHTQADLRRSLKASSSRMPAIIEVLEEGYRIGGLVRVVETLCKVEAEWSGSNAEKQDKDPFGQLDLILEEIREDCNS